jgi:hypothetical protein
MPRPPLAVIEREAEDLRLERRSSTRAQIAAGQLLREKIAALDSEITRLDDVVRAAADTHSAVCLPLQSELAALEADAVARIQQRVEPDAAADARRREILAEIQRQNSALEQARLQQEQLKAPLLQQRLRLEMEAGSMPTNATLAGRTLGNPRLLREQFVIGERLRWLTSQRNYAVQCSNRAAAINATVNGGLAADWAAVVDAVDNQLADARRDSRRIREALIAE